MNDMWKILGIATTDDLSVIKKAYAKMLRQYHPEDDPEGFQRLKEAYDSACRHAKWVKQHQERKSESSEQDAYIPPVILPHHKFDQAVLEQAQTMDVQIQALLERTAMLYADFSSRIVYENWHELLESDIMWNIQAKTRIGSDMLVFMKTHRYLPQIIWQLLNQTFAWTEQAEGLHPYYSDPFTEYICLQVTRVCPICYEYYQFPDGFDIEKYLKNVDNALMEFEKNAYASAIQFVRIANNLLGHDPNLFFMEVLYELRNGCVLQTQYDQIIKMNILPNDVAGLLALANTYQSEGIPAKAISVFTQLSQMLPNNDKITYSLSQQYRRLGDWEMSYHWLYRTLVINSKHEGALQDVGVAEQRWLGALRKRRMYRPFDKVIGAKIKQVNTEIKQRNRTKSKGFKFSYYRFAVIIVFCLLIVYANINNQDSSLRPSDVDKQNYHNASTDVFANLNVTSISKLGAGVNKVLVLFDSIYGLQAVSTLKKDANGNGTREFLRIEKDFDPQTNDAFEGYVYIGEVKNEVVLFIAKDNLFVNPQKYRGVQLVGTIQTHTPIDGMKNTLIRHANESKDASKMATPSVNKSIIFDKLIIVEQLARPPSPTKTRSNSSFGIIGLILIVTMFSIKVLRR
ncbi:MAG: hypothetical protein H7Y41_00770 [Hyphomonadaceae bacterium]|nr:hypothetical protein [Clostridia bacterium]